MSFFKDLPEVNFLPVREYPEVTEAEVLEWQGWEDNVIIHENLHASVGGVYAGAPEYDYELKRDGKYYIVSGRVMIDTSFDESKPEEMLLKHDIIYRAALAPSDPSDADKKIAGEASANLLKASALLSEKKSRGPHSVFDGNPIFPVDS